MKENVKLGYSPEGELAEGAETVVEAEIFTSDVVAFVVESLEVVEVEFSSDRSVVEDEG
jgi:hypothetical protein